MRLKINMAGEVVKTGSTIRSSNGPQWESSFIDVAFTLSGKVFRVWDVELTRKNVVFIQGFLDTKKGQVDNAFIEYRGKTLKGKPKNQNGMV